METPTYPLHAEPRIDSRGDAWVEAHVTGQAAIDLARGVIQRLAGQGILGGVTESLVTLAAGAITDTTLAMDAGECEDLGHNLIDVATHAASPEFVDAVMSA